MRRTNIYLTDEQRAALAARAAAEGTSAAALVRRLIDQALFGPNDDLAHRAGELRRRYRRSHAATGLEPPFPL
jgi:plasmid stability protein